MEEYLKQNVNRHKSEKMLDKFIYKSEKKECELLEKKLKQIEKINEVSLNRKKYRSEQIPENQQDNIKTNSISKADMLKEKIKKMNKEIESKQTTNQVDVDYSLEKILKHITNKDKFSKCLKLLKELVSSKLDSFIPISLIKSFYIIIYTIPFKFQEKEDRTLIEDLFNLVDKQSFDIFDSEEKKIWESFYIPIKYQLKLITDDSFTFSSIIKQIEKAYGELTNHNDKEQKLISLFEKMNQIIRNDSLKNEETLEEQDYSIVFKEINTLVECLKRKFLFDCFKQAFIMHKMNWASVPINTIFKKAYIEKVKFNPSQNNELENMINIMKNNTGNLNSVDNQRQKMDEKIKNNPLDSYYKVSDSRSEVAVLGDGSVWEAKQAGLTASKMYINN